MSKLLALCPAFQVAERSNPISNPLSKKWKGIKKDFKKSKYEKNERYIPFISLIFSQSSVYWDHENQFMRAER